MSEPILKVEHLNRFFGALHATNDVFFEVSDGQMRAVTGPNGAGKSTLMDSVCNCTTSSSGKVIFRGEGITGLTPHKIARRGMYKCFQITQIFPNLTVYENVQIAQINMNKKVFHFPPVKDTYLKDEVTKYLAVMGIEDKAEEIAGFMSYGDQRRLDIAIALTPEPKPLILDESVVGVTREEAHKLMDLIRKLGKEQHMAIVFIEHDMEIVLNYADKISVMSNGVLIVPDTPEKIRQNESAQQAYLGGAE